jgi:hypothetical protein
VHVLSENCSLHDLLTQTEQWCYYDFHFDKTHINHPFPAKKTVAAEAHFIGWPWPILIVTGKEPISKILTLCGVFNTGAAAKAAGYLKPIPKGYSELKVGKASGIYGFTKRKFCFYMIE